jgi:hypothetical protein
MKCPECVRTGLKSIVHVDDWCLTFDTAFGQTYYDEEGRHHVHDSNLAPHGFRCSNGHKGSIWPSSRCPNCDYGVPAFIRILREGGFEDFPAEVPTPKTTRSLAVKKS